MKENITVDMKQKENESSKKTKEENLNDENENDNFSFDGHQAQMNTRSSSKSLSNDSDCFDDLRKTYTQSSHQNLNILLSCQRKHSSPESLTPEEAEENFELNFIGDEEQIRFSYYKGLVYKGIWTSTQETKKLNALIIFDWDDTLFCTTILSRFGYFDNDLKVKPINMTKIRKMEALVKNLLEKTLDKGDTYIITNAEPGWVEYCCERFFPDVNALLPKIKIISARGLYEKQFPKNGKKWKIEAFKNIVKDYSNSINLPTNIICLGDSLYDLKAGRILAKNFPNSFIKTIKFREYPSIDELIIQLKLVNDKFSFIYKECKNWTIKVEKKLKTNENI